MTYHSGLIRGGFLGVDMFFTLSGFLITRLLLQERAATGAINLKGFYVANWAGIHGLPMGIFGHTWSLAIEEQFYLVWPLAVAVLVGGLRRPRLIACLLSLAAVVSFA